jgi:hypothetical protein
MVSGVHVVTARTFPLGDILTVTTDRFVTPDGMGAVYELLNFMTGDNLFTHQLPRASGECRPALLAQHPDLTLVVVPEEFDDEAHVWRWLAEQVARFSASREVTPLDPADHTRIDPVAELKMLRPDMPAIPVLGEDGEIR